MVRVSTDSSRLTIGQAIARAKLQRRIDLRDAVCLVAAARNRDASLLDSFDRQDCWPILRRAWEKIRGVAADGKIELHGNDVEQIPESGIPVIHPDRLAPTLRWVESANSIVVPTVWNTPEVNLDREVNLQAGALSWVDVEYDDRIRAALFPLTFWNVSIEGKQLATLVAEIEEPEPAVSSPTVALETACRRWLEELMMQSPKLRPKRKRDYYTDACTQFEVPQQETIPRWFERAWTAAMRETNVSEVWGRAGAPKKSGQV